MPFAHRIKNLRGSSTLKASQLCREKREQGHDIIPMNVGESDLVVPLCVQAAAIEAIHAGNNGYSNTRGIPLLREKIAEVIQETQDISLRPDQVLVTPGAKSAIHYALMSLVNPGDEVIIPAPYWPSFKDMIEYAGGVMVPVTSSVENNFDVPAEKIEEAITEKTRMIILNSPSNPTGRVMSAELLRDYGRVLSKYPDIWIMCDSIYEYMYWGEEPLAYLSKECPHLHNRIISVSGFSKIYSMCGWRLGYISCLNDDLMEHMHNLQTQTNTHPNTIAQHSAIAAINNSYKIHQEVVYSYKERHNYLYHALKEIPDFELAPSCGSMFLFPRVTKLIRKLGLRDDEALSEYLIEHTHISTIPGSHFGLQGYIRLSFAVRQDKLEKAVERIKSLPGLGSHIDT